MSLLTLLTNRTLEACSKSGIDGNKWCCSWSTNKLYTDAKNLCPYDSLFRSDDIDVCRKAADAACKEDTCKAWGNQLTSIRKLVSDYDVCKARADPDYHYTILKDGIHNFVADHLSAIVLISIVFFGCICPLKFCPLEFCRGLRFTILTIYRFGTAACACFSDRRRLRREQAVQAQQVQQMSAMNDGLLANQQVPAVPVQVETVQ